MRTVIGGAIGAAIAVAAWLALEHITHTNLGWLVCLVGLATGIGVSRASKSNASDAIVRGILAIVITLAAILGGRQAYAALVQSGALTTMKTTAVVKQGTEAQKDTNDSNASATEATPAEDPKAAESETTDTEADEPAETGESTDEQIADPPMPRELVQIAGPGAKPVPVKSYATKWDTLWMCLAALTAYFTGKKSRAPVVESEPSESS